MKRLPRGFRDTSSIQPVGACGASAQHAQEHDLEVGLGTGANVFPWPEVVVTHVGKKVEDGVVTDEVTRGFVEKAIVAFADWV